ncbi:hypothetical protein D3C75_1250230 [compost metagenome]
MLRPDLEAQPDNESARVGQLAHQVEATPQVQPAGALGDHELPPATARLVLDQDLPEAADQALAHRAAE